MSYRRVVKIVCQEYKSSGITRCIAITFDSRGLKTGGCDVVGNLDDAVKECLTLKERNEDHEIIVK